jgi:hypothetical protein
LKKPIKNPAGCQGDGVVDSKANIEKAHKEPGKVEILVNNGNG